MSSRKRRGRGEGGIRYREDKQLYVGEVRLGDGKRRTVYGTTKTEVLEKLRSLQNQSLAGIDGGNIRVADYLNRWLRDTVQGTVAATTADRYEQVVRLHLIPKLGAARLDKLTALHIESLYAGLARDGVSAGTRRKIAEVVVNALNHAVRLKLIPWSPAAGVRRPKMEQKEIRIMDGADVQKFLAAAAGNRLEAFFALAIYGGLREGELLGLHWPDLGFEARTVRVERSLAQVKGEFLIKEPKSKRSRRTVSLPTIAIDALHEHRKRMLAEGHDVKSGPLFVTGTGTFIGKSNLIREVFHPLLAKAGLFGFRIHDLRHTHASHLLARGVPLKDVSVRLGHSSEALTLKVYAHLLPSSGQELQSKLERLFDANGGTMAVQAPEMQDAAVPQIAAASG
jgi:integrase